jgi:CDGSH-type Zn-finger protein/uncharacterized Fe-S cluster protein YjdI
MVRRKHTFDSDELVVEFDAGRCIHAEECVHGSPEVFNAARRPWIDPTRASPSDVVRVIERCPTGALQYTWRNDEEGEQAPSTNTVRAASDGPLYLHGSLRISLPDGETLDEIRLALCRCGHSQAKPFCDNAHLKAGFSDDGVLSQSRLTDGGQSESAVLEISLAPNGPVLIRGPVQVLGTGGETAKGSSGALCRCGHSAVKPFCDGAHKREGFVSDQG